MNVRRLSPVSLVALFAGVRTARLSWSGGATPTNKRVVVLVGAGVCCRTLISTLAWPLHASQSQRRPWIACHWASVAMLILCPDNVALSDEGASNTSPRSAAARCWAVAVS